MGWSERGKNGVHTGRTLRQQPTTGRYGVRRSPEGVIVKYKTNTVNVRNSDVKSLLQDRYGLTDGLDVSFVPNLGDYGIAFSLGKRKRWLIPDLVKERVDEDVAVDSEDEKEIHLCFQTRYIGEQYSFRRPDCVSIYSDHEGELKPKHKYSFYTDIRHKDKDSKPPEVGYEICQPPPPTSWPNFSQENQPSFDYQFRRNGRKAKCKSKGMKKIRCHSLCEEELYAEKYKVQAECKVTTVFESDFLLAGQELDSEKDFAQFTLGEFITKRQKQDHKKARDKGEKTVTSGVVKYGKGDAVYVDAEIKKPQIIEPEKNHVKSWKEHQECAVNITVDVEEIKVESLQAEWNDCYSEATVFPRKFRINISSLLPPNKLNTNTTANVVFEVHDKAPKDGTQVNISVKLVCALIDGTSEMLQAAKDFASCLTKPAPGGRTWAVRKVVEIAAQLSTETFSEQSLKDHTAHCHTTHNGQIYSIPNLNFLNEICGWQSEVFILQQAQKQIQEKFENEAVETNIPDSILAEWQLLSVECGICYEQCEESSNKVTRLKECGHAFCNECWVGHLEAQVSQGIEQFKCPGYECDCKLDNTTVMCLAPELYLKMLNIMVNRHLETSPEWKWCPRKCCQKVVKATGGSDNAFTVLCSCRHAWCFKCRKPSHWPASCAESERFLQKSGNYKNWLEMDSKDIISSVMVKNCPSCDYPIEKHFGCQFMWCVLCNVHFCWNCLAITSYGHTCDKQPTDDLTEVVLNSGNKRYVIQKYMDIIHRSTKARNPRLLSQKRRKTMMLETGMESHCAVTSQCVLPDKELNKSTVETLLDKFVKNRLAENVKEAVEFEFQARLALEGFAQKAAVSRCVGGMAVNKMSQLTFVVEKIDIMLQEPSSLCGEERITWFKQLVEIGKDCILILKKSSSNMP